jgi:two-component system, NarL family, sensor histidine kinase UhpB
MTLRVRINLVITLVTAAFTVAMVHVIVNDVRSSVREEIESTTRVAVQLVEAVVGGVYLEPGPGERTETLLALLRRVGHVRANDIRFYDPGGTLLYQSPPSTYRSGKRAPEWFSALVHPEIPEARLTLPGGAIVVTPDASRSIIEAWDDLKGFALLALAFLVLVNAAVFWLLERALRPLPQILEGLGQLARGRIRAP